MKLILFFFCLLNLFNTVGNTQLLNHITFGKHRVGFKSFLQFDYSRPARTKGQYGRAVQVNVWYPASSGEGRQINIKQYISLEGMEDSIVSGKETDTKTLNHFLGYVSSQGGDMELWKAYLQSTNTMKAIQNAPFLKGSFPVALLLHGSALQYALIGEFLASHGMMAINVPYKGYMQYAFDVNVAGMETEMRDMEYALDVIIKKFKIQPQKIGVVGISFGGQSAVGMAVRNPLIKGIVSLDGGIGSTFGPQLLAGHPFFSLDKVTMPILHLYNPKDQGGNTDWFDVCKYNDRYLISLNNMDHAFFGIYGWLDRHIPYVFGKSKPRPGNNTEVILQSTLLFFNTVFGGVMDKPLNLVEKYPWMDTLVAAEVFYKKELIPLPQDVLIELLQTKGTEGIKEARQKQKALTIMPISDNSYRALFLNRFSQQDNNGMLEMAALYRTDFPNAALAAYYYGRALQSNNRAGEAKTFFNHCLTLLPADNTLTPSEKEAYKSRCENLLK